MCLNLANFIARDDVKCFCRKTHLYGENQLLWYVIGLVNQKEL